MSYSELLKNLGFNADPFATTNADEEENLEEYFVPPPFFKAVYGQPISPKSDIVFAPRGGGKTALKRKIELSSVGKDFLCIAYNDFDVSGLKLKDVNAEFHLINLVELVLTAVVTAVSTQGINNLSNEDRHLLYLLIRQHFTEIDQTKLKQNISCIKNFEDKAKDLWNKFTGPLGLVINGLLEKIGFGTTELKGFQKAGGKLGSLKDQLAELQRISRRLGYDSIYVLIDRIDETPVTGDAKSSYQFIESLIGDLHLLESKGFGFKFFLWNLLLDDYRRVARPDRVKYYSLDWQAEQLTHVLSERLKAFSSGRVKSLQQISDQISPVSIDLVASVFAQGSPRLLIRICREIIDQQSEIEAAADKISHKAIDRGINAIAENVTHEIFSAGAIREMQRVRRCDFTIKYIYSDIFKFTQQAALNKVRSWESSGAVYQIGTIQETTGSKPSNHYGLAHFLFAKHVFEGLSMADFLKQKFRSCSACGSPMLRDWDLNRTQQCDNCQHENTA